MTDPIKKSPTVYADSVSILTALLKPDRCRLFLDWLCAHSSQVIQGYDLDQIHTSLVTWFESLLEPDALREYELVISEIDWWRELKQEDLARMLDEAG